MSLERRTGPVIQTRAGVTGVSATTGGGGIGGAYSNVRVTRPSASTATVTSDSLTVTDTNGTPTRILSVSETVDITASGAGGLDTGSEASSTWYFIWIIRKSSDGTVDGLLSVSSTSPTMPAGYDQKALVSAVRNDGSSNFVDFVQNGNVWEYTSWPTITSGNVGTGAWVSITMSAYVPSALSVFCYGSAPFIGGVVGNDSTAATGLADGRNRLALDDGAVVGIISSWQFTILTADTLYWMSSQANAIVRIQGFIINKIT